MRADADRFAVAPFPATPFVASARLTDGSWRFVTEDGTVYRAASAVGALTVIGALPHRAEPLRREGAVLTRGAHSLGALAVIDTTLRAWTVDASGAARAMPLERVIAVCFTSPDEVLAVTEPGVLRVSRDGGRSFSAARPPAGVALSVWTDSDGARVRTTAGTFRYERGALSPIASGDGIASLSRVATETLARLDEGVAASTRDRSGRVELSRSRLASIEGDSLVITDARRGVALSLEPMPGEGCELSPAFHGLRATCRHQAWARLIASRDADRAGWSVLRDEANAEPMGPAVFDDVSDAWAVHAPCAQTTTLDPRDVCIYDAQGVKHRARLLVDADLAAMHDGVAWAVSAAAGDVAPSLVAVRVDAVSTIALPDEARAPVRVFVDARGLAITYARRGGVTLARRAIREGAAWSKYELPAGFERAHFRRDGTLFAWGSDARYVGRVAPGAMRFEADAPIVAGDASLVALDLDASARCVGAWCRFGGALSVDAGPRGAAPVLTRRDAPVDASRVSSPQREVRCEHGAASSAPEIDRGAAASGYAVRAALRGASLNVTWSGATLRGAIAAPFTARAGARVFPRGVQGATAPAALVEVCAETGCDHVFASLAGLTDLGLGRARAGAVDVMRSPNGFVVRADALIEGLDLVTLIALDARGAITARRTYALATTRDRAHIGSWMGADGLWIEDRQARLRFVALDARDLEGAVVANVPAPGEGTRNCAAGVRARGEVHMAERVAQVRGREWFVEVGEWQVEEVLAVDAGSVCARTITGGEARDEDEARAGGREEREPVRSFSLRAEGDVFVGSAWSGERAIALRCTRE